MLFALDYTRAGDKKKTAGANAYVVELKRSGQIAVSDARS